MHSLAVPASYRAFVEASLALVAAEIRRDVSRRADDDERIQKLATVPTDLIDHAAAGTLTLTLDVMDWQPVGQLQAFAPITR